VIPSAGELGIYVWRPASGTEIVVGRSEDRRPIDLKSTVRGLIEFGGTDNAPLNTTLILRGGDLRWEIRLSADDFHKLRTLRLPRGRYSMRLEAEGYKAISYISIQAEDRPFVLPRLVFVRNPRISGNVSRKDGSPVPGATVVAGEKLVGHTDEQGRFAFTPADTIPREIAISHPGFAPATAAVFYSGSGDVVLGRLFLLSGGSLTVALEPKCAACNTNALLYRLFPRGSPSKRLIATKQVPDAPAKLTFDDLAAGPYALVLSGDHAIEQKGVQFDLAEGEQKNQSVTIASFHLDGSVALGKELLAGARVHFSSLDGLSNGEATSRADGTFDVDVWQEGRYTVEISGANISEPFITRREITSTTLGLDFVLPNRMIAGRVLDEATHQPVSGATVRVDYRGDEVAQSQVPLVSDTAGNILWPNARPGEYQLKPTAPGYNPGAPRKLHISADDSDISVELLLRRADRLSLRITDEKGKPLVGAHVVSRIANHGLTSDDPIITSADGLAEVAIDPGVVTLVYVITGDGGLAVLRTSHSESDRTHDVVLPEATSQVVARIVDADHQPLAGASVLMLFGNELIPPVVMRYLSALQRLSSESSPDGRLAVGRLPPGDYRFWPYRGLNDLAKLYRNFDLFGPPASIRLSSGAVSFDVIRQQLP
jgi:hypothetical protein